MKSKMLL